MDDEAYLPPNFDPNTLRCADLRKILLFHNVDYPSSARKPQLVQLVIDEVLPAVPKILEKRNVLPIPPKIEIIWDKKGQVQPQIFLREVWINYEIN